VGRRLTRRRPASAAVVLIRSAKRWPLRPGVIDDDGTLTLAELHEHVRDLAGALHARGIGPGSVVGLFCHQHAGLVEAALATVWVGAEPAVIEPHVDHVMLADIARDRLPDLLVHDAVLHDIVRKADLGVTTLVSDAHGSGSVTAVRSFGRPAPSPARSTSSSLEGTSLAAVMTQIGLGRPIVLTRAQHD
jgi:acyl-CoA synthetase (AMP-forming)/AMP-acid ligase II